MDYKIEIEIDQPREKVGELFENVENLKFWQPGFVSAEIISGEPKTEGSKWRLRYLNRGRDVELIETVTRYRIPKEFSATYEAPGMMIEVQNFFYEAGQGKTRWVSHNSGKVSGFLMRLVVILIPGSFKKQSREYMENFKAFAETGADVRAGG